MQPKLILASASPRRKQLLEQLGVEFVVQSVKVDESAKKNETPEDYVCRIAEKKARSMHVSADVPILAADTAGEIEGRLLVKPNSRSDAIEMLSAMSGNTHKVITTIVLLVGDICEKKCVVSEVTFRDLSKQQIERYCDTGEPFDKAGAYAIQGYGGALVTHIVGSYSGVVGLPLAETAELLDNFGIPYWQKKP